MNIDLMENTIKKREKIEDKYTWDLSTIFTSLEDWEKEFNELEESVSTFEKFRGTNPFIMQSVYVSKSLYFLHDVVTSSSYFRISRTGSLTHVDWLFNSVFSETTSIGS